MPTVENIHGFDLKGRNRGTMKIKCPFCHDTRKNKSDRSLYINLDSRVFRCFNCEKKGQIDGWKPDREYNEPKKSEKWHRVNEEGMAYLAKRGIGERVIIRNRLFQAERWFGDTNPREECIAFPYFDHTHTRPKNIKFRAINSKMFGQEKDCIPLMYNIHEWSDLEEVIICEGEIDVLSLNECEIWNATSVNAGAINPNDENIDGKLQCLYNSHQYFDNKKKVILFCDRDLAGQRLERELIAKLGAYRCYQVTAPKGYKDANEVLNGDEKKGLSALGKEALKEIIKSAKPVPISGVIYIDDIEEAMLYNFKHGKVKGSTTHIKGFDEIFLWKKGDVNLWTGWANFGKTTFCLHCMLLKSVYDHWKWAIFSPENYPPEDFYDDLIEMYVGKHVNNRLNNKMSETEYRNAMAFIKEHFVYVYPEEEQTIENLHDVFKGLLLKYGIDGVLLDPFNQLDSTQSNTRDDQYISRVLKLVKRFCLEHQISYNIIAHPKGIGKGSDGKKPIPDAYDIAGGAMWANKSDNIIIVHRPDWDTDKDSGRTQVLTDKIKRRRTGGKIGDVFMIYNQSFSRFREEGSDHFPLDPSTKDYGISSKFTPIGDIDPELGF